MDAHDITIKNVKIYDSWSDGIEAQTSGNANAKLYNFLIDNVDLQRSGLNRGDGAKLIDIDGVSARFYFTGAQNHHIIRNSNFVQGTHNAIDLHESVNDILIYNNRFERARTHGPVALHNWEVFRVSIIDNTMIDSQQDLTFVGAYNNFIARNNATGATSGMFVIGLGTYCSSYPSADIERCYATWTPNANNIFMDNKHGTTGIRFSMQGGTGPAGSGKEGTGYYYHTNKFIREDTSTINFMNLSLSPATDFVNNEIIDFVRTVQNFDFGYRYIQSTTNTRIIFTDNTVFTMSSSGLGTPVYSPIESSLTLPTTTSVEYFSATKYAMTARPATGTATVTVNSFNTSLISGILANFTADSTNGNNVTFTVSTLKPSTNYLIKKGTVDYATVQSDSSGKITFANSVWPSSNFTVEETTGGTPIVSAPIFSPVQGTYSSTQTVTISSATPGSTIYYTTNGSTPTASSTQYTAPITVFSTVTIRALAIRSGYADSSVSSAIYTIAIPVLTSIIITPATASIGTGSTQLFTATPRDQFNNTMTGITISWTSSNTAIANISLGGIATGVAQGVSRLIRNIGY